MIAWNEEKNGKIYEIDAKEPVTLYEKTSALTEVIPEITILVYEKTESIFDKCECYIMHVRLLRTKKVEISVEKTDSAYFPTQRIPITTKEWAINYSTAWFLYLDELREKIRENGVLKTIKEILKLLEIPPECFPIK